jgi:hypothetical protein
VVTCDGTESYHRKERARDWEIVLELALTSSRNSLVHLEIVVDGLPVHSHRLAVLIGLDVVDYCHDDLIAQHHFKQTKE